MKWSFAWLILVHVAFFKREHFATVEEGLAVFMNDPLANDPGSAYLYSSYGFNLLGAVIEGASGQPYTDYMTEHVTGPLGMTRTVPDWLAPSAPPLAAVETLAPAPAADMDELNQLLVEHGEFTGSAALNGLVSYAKFVSQGSE